MKDNPDMALSKQEQKLVDEIQGDLENIKRRLKVMGKIQQEADRLDAADMAHDFLGQVMSLHARMNIALRENVAKDAGPTKRGDR